MDQEGHHHQLRHHQFHQLHRELQFLYHRHHLQQKLNMLVLYFRNQDLYLNLLHQLHQLQDLEKLLRYQHYQQRLLHHHHLIHMHL